VASGPILAVHDGLDALNVALNVLAIVFVFEADDVLFAACLSTAQKAYLGTVQIPLSQPDQRHMAWLGLGVAVAGCCASLFPIILCDPMASPVDNFAGWFDAGEPVKTFASLSAIFFGSLVAVDFFYMLCLSGPRARVFACQSFCAAFCLAFNFLLVLTMIGNDTSSAESASG